MNISSKNILVELNNLINMDIDINKKMYVLENIYAKAKLYQVLYNKKIKEVEQTYMNFYLNEEIMAKMDADHPFYKKKKYPQNENILKLVNYEDAVILKLNNILDFSEKDLNINNYKKYDIYGRDVSICRTVSNNFANYYTKLLLTRWEISKRLGYENYFEYKNYKNNKDDILNLLDKIGDFQIVPEKDLHKKKITNLSFKEFIVTFIKLIKKIFDITLTGVDGEETWNEEVICLSVVYNKKKVCEIHIDITKIVIDNPFTTIINENVIIIPFVINIKSINDKNMNYSDIVNIFKEFSKVIYYIINKHKIVSDISVVEKIMEYIAWDKHVINTFFPIDKNETKSKTNETLKLKDHTNKTSKDLLNIENKEIVSNLEKTRKIEIINNLKQQSINALFDYMIHTNKGIITDCRKLVNNDLLNKLLIDLYVQINKRYGIEKTFISLDLCKDLVNNSGKIYENILIEVYASEIYKNLMSSGDVVIDMVKETNLRQYYGEIDIKDFIKKFNL
jgi:hypothetical protein